MQVPRETLAWLTGADEPWVRRIVRDQFDAKVDEPGLDDAVCDHGLIRDLVRRIEEPWPVLKGHNKSDHPLNLLRLLWELGGGAVEDRVRGVLGKIFSGDSADGLPLTLQSGYKLPEPIPGWIMCDAPLYVGLAARVGMADDPRVRRAAEAVAGLAQSDGWGCVHRLEGFTRGPGRKGDPCPMAILDALYALAPFPDIAGCPAVAAGVDTVHKHLVFAYDHKLFMFGAGRKFWRLRYPHAWYDAASVLSVLVMVDAGREDHRTSEMARRVLETADEMGRFTPLSIYMAWKGTDFGRKKEPSPTLTARMWTILNQL